jgi:hypothetical protein
VGGSRTGALAALAAVVVLAGGCTGARPAPEPSYGDLPAFLPSGAARPHSVLTASVEHPALATQGDAVRVQLPGTSVLVTVTGPEVPGDGLPYETKATTCTWTVTMTGAVADVPVTVADFRTLDHFGTGYRLAPIPGRPAPPAVLRRGATATFELRTVMTVGEGLLRWSPGGKATVASWDFVVEND